MKNTSVLAAVSAALMLFASCQKSPVATEENGYLSFGEFALEVDEDVVTKADPAGDNYSISILNADEQVVLTKTYAEVKNNSNMISLPAGAYTLVARSLAGDIPVAS